MFLNDVAKFISSSCEKILADGMNIYGFDNFTITFDLWRRYRFFQAVRGSSSFE